MTEGQRLQMERKSSNADSELGNSDWNYSNRDWFDKKEDLEDSNKINANEKNDEKETELNEVPQETPEIFPDTEDNDKAIDIADDACEVINAKAPSDEKESKDAEKQNEQIEGIQIFLQIYFLTKIFFIF
jgi:hypothetical protein